MFRVPVFVFVATCPSAPEVLGPSCLGTAVSQGAPSLSDPADTLH